MLTAGLHWIDSATYHGDPAPAPSLSSTLARILINQSPLHAWTAHPRLNPDHEPNDRKVFDIGRAAHRAVLGKGDDYEAIPAELLGANGSVSTKAAKEWVAEARERGVTPLKEDEVEQIERIAERVRSKLQAARIVLDLERSEVAALAEIDGVWCRAMVDNAPADRPYLIDFKTTTDASPEACIRAIVNYGYDVQAAHYLACWEAVTGERRAFRFVMTEKEPPYETSVVELLDAPDDPGDWMADARSKIAEARFLWGRHLESGEWPGYPAKVARVEAPNWHRQKWADRALFSPLAKPDPETLRRASAWQSPEGMTA